MAMSLTSQQSGNTPNDTEKENDHQENTSKHQKISTNLYPRHRPLAQLETSGLEKADKKSGSVDLINIRGEETQVQLETKY